MKHNGYYLHTDNWHLVDEVIQNFVGRTGLSENVWHGRRRLNTGLRYDNPAYRESYNELTEKLTNAERLDFINIDDITTQLANDTTELLERLQIDPMGLDLTDFYEEKTHCLFALILLIARKLKNDEEIFVGLFPSDIVLRLPKGTSEHLNSKGLPPYVRFGTEIQELIKRLFWATSIGYANKDHYMQMRK